MKTYFRLLSFAKPIEKFAIPYVICALLAVLFGTMNLVLVGPLLNTLFMATDEVDILAKPDNWMNVIDWFNYYAQEISTMYGAYGALKLVCIVIVCSVFLSNLFRYFSQRIMENLKIHTLLNLRKTVFNNVMDLHVGYFNNQRKGDIISKISSDVQVVQFSVTGTLQVVFKEPLQLLFYIVSLLMMSVELTLFALLIIPISGFFISKIVKKLKQQAMEAQSVYGQMISYLDEALSGIKIIKAFNAVEFVKKRFNEENAYYSNIGRRMARRQQLGSPVSEFLGVIMVAVILLYGGNLVINGDQSFTAGTFIAYIAIFSQVMRPAKALTDSFTNIHSGIAAGERVLDLIDQKPGVVDLSDAKSIDSFNDEIRLENIGFDYDEKSVLSNVNMVIPKGSTIALVGPSGGGKSTLMDLIPRFMDPLKGRILIDDKDIRDLKVDSLRNLMGIVNQDLVLFNDTIANNIAFGIENASEESIIAAAKIANAHDFIMESELGYQTNIGDRGIKLSGGQKQRLCIARAVLKNPPILLLDEATSALDTESEKLVQEALNNLMKSRTSLVIAHRLSTIQQADKIFVLDKGKIVEEGTHTELLVKEGVYRKLIEMQQFYH
ncbi:ABC transporter ATP-binding protein [Albibacterium sp.]|uniref:ABC transporter ATP-binding protein n=1 Tax=Albibacterium sp. TaxID=2952885 RepID=UPI002CE04292|nr:ABC transporter transmembrane domain-containing protein [Albibacterium sp.]HUH17701.1 ABC transporter transmembrane domain-containing protein [Albibacterium sp.]